MQTQALSSRLFFRSQPLGTIWIDSPLPAAVVLENLRNRGREWRSSAFPEDLRKYRVNGLIVETEGSQFQLRWRGDATNPLHNPRCFGSVQPYGDGSRIRAGFKLFAKDFVMVGCGVASVALILLGGRSASSFAFAAIFLAVLISMAVRNRSAEPLRARLIEVLAKAAQK